VCGIFGFFNTGVSQSESDVMISKMSKAQHHRGPDNFGFHQENFCTLGNNRLSIIDLENGNQPFFSGDGKIVVVQNGEIFNHIELAAGLENSPYSCITGSDTEVILRLYENEGPSFVSKLNGMFSIAIYDARIQKLFLFRDRVGEKPLFYSTSGKSVYFASEMKSLLEVGIDRDINKKAVASFFLYNYVMPPMTIFKDIHILQPGHYLECDANGIQCNRWWDLPYLQSKNDFTLNEDEIVEEFNFLLDDAVKIRMRADVPFGAFLSGGVDSSSVVGLMSKHSAFPIKTFCIGFNDPDFDESAFALEASKRFSTEHYLKKVDSNLLKHWPKVILHTEQPHGDVSFMPTYEVAKLASKHVKMVLTGDGADELFGGYSKYLGLKDLDKSNHKKVLLDSFSLLTPNSLGQLFDEAFIDSSVIDELERDFNKIIDGYDTDDYLNKAFFFDTQYLLQGNNLVKPDRMGMSVSIENRSPFLDYRMVEFASKIPSKYKIRNQETKYIYKKSVESLIGSNLTYRDKQMFTVPIKSWISGELKSYFESVIFPTRLSHESIFNQQFLKETFDNHCNHSADNTRLIRAVTSYNLWSEKFKGA
tara:strand:- start:4283 stop:6052 length:1770 start_codon:yes stop_codon:yes gene_type:complete